MKPEDKRKVENALISMGLSGTEDPELFTVFAQVVEQFPGDKHWFFRGMLNECEPQKRRDMYYALRPRFVRFTPLPLASYEAQIAEEAGRMVACGMMRVEGAEPAAILIGEQHYVPTDEAHATDVAVRLTCSKCTRQRLFVGATMVDAIIKASKKGWVYDPVTEKRTCPKCPAVRPNA